MGERFLFLEIEQKDFGNFLTHSVAILPRIAKTLLLAIRPNPANPEDRNFPQQKLF